ncbi:MAG: response regulator [Anaerolineae bacterium]|nr:response regulator [Anaerolineae bacterium]
MFELMMERVRSWKRRYITLHVIFITVFIATVAAMGITILVEGHIVWKVVLGSAASSAIATLGTGLLASDFIEHLKNTEDALKESEAHTRALLDAVPDLLFVLSSEGVFLDYKSATGSTTYRSPDEFLGKALHEVLPPALAEETLHHIQEAHETGEVTQFEYQIMVKGELRDYEARCTSTSPGRILVIVRNITQQKHAERALAASEAEYRALYRLIRLMADNVPDLIWAKDLEKRYLFANKAICTKLLSARDTDEPIGKNDLFFASRERDAHPHDLQWHTFGEICQDSDSIVMASQEAQRFDEFGNVKGEFLYLDVYKAPFWDENGAMIGTVGCGRIVTQEREEQERRRQAEAALKAERASLARRVEERTTALQTANAQLAQALRAKDEFLANMSHELRTPLTTILALAEMMQHHIYGPLDERQDKAMRHIEESGRHLLALITQILDLSKIEAGKLALDLEEVDVEATCQASLRLIEQMAKGKQLHIRYDRDEQVTTFQADALRLKQILVNLLSNAVKFTPEGGYMGLEVQGDQEAGILRFNVWDTGIGIAEEDLSQLFHPFVQLDTGLAREYGGSGLGLALVYRLTRLHGGSVSVKSTVGQGSQFTISLPWRQADGNRQEMPRKSKANAPAINTQASNQAHYKSPLILIADDNTTSREILRDALTAHGFRVQTAPDGISTLNQIQTDQPDLVLLDIQMPGMDGFEVIQRIRAAPRTRSLPIVTVTAMAMPGDRERCLEAGADIYVSKPLQIGQLLETIRALTGFKPV